MKNDKDLDVIRVWFCEKCESYVIDFLSNRVYCDSCGIQMQKRIYQELKKEVSDQLGRIEHE